MEGTVPKRQISKKTILIVVGIILAIVIIFLLVKHFMGENQKYSFESIDDTTSFFIQNKEGKSALFNEDGKQLTEFVFDSNGSFYGGVSKVTTEDGKYGIIKEDGKYLVELGDDYISDYDSLFVVHASATDKEYVINSKGETILEGYDITIHSFYNPYIYYVEVESEKDKEPDKVQVLNYAGKVMDTIPNEEYFTSSNPLKGYTTLSDGKKTYVYNLDEGKKVTEVDGGYCVAYVEGNKVLLSSCSTWYSSDDTNGYVVLEKGKEKYKKSKDECGLTLLSDGSVVCRTDAGDNVFVSDDGTLSSTKFDDAIDGKNYVVHEGEQYVFYENGKKANTLDCVSVSRTLEDGYILYHSSSRKCSSQESGYAYYNKKGEKVSDTFYSATTFDDNERAIVSTDKSNYYLIDSKYQKVTDTYSRIYQDGNLYEVTKDQEDIMIDKDGKQIAAGYKDYKTISRHEGKEKFIAFVYDNKVEIYNSITGKKIGEVEGSSINLTEHYYYYGDHYYSYNTGKEFYQRQ